MKHLSTLAREGFIKITNIGKHTCINKRERLWHISTCGKHARRNHWSKITKHISPSLSFCGAYVWLWKEWLLEKSKDLPNGDARTLRACMERIMISKVIGTFRVGVRYTLGRYFQWTTGRRPRANWKIPKASAFLNNSGHTRGRSAIELVVAPIIWANGSLI